ncbi:MAG TPA: glycoside hydrolase family 38 C-terminal domain-containing protein, partial [Fimbriimonas sp.]|nr:glycoside hydrolase family 38 C-terminal domain-containing protein [Fimbriimonas sp.]
MPRSLLDRRRACRAGAFVAALAAVSVAMASPTPSKAKDTKHGAKRPALYLVGYSHLDTEWLWCYPQVIREFIPKTLHDNFALLDKYPDYTFNWTGSNRYRLMKEYYPEDYEKLKKYIAAGRWVTAGSSVEEGDVNSPSEESLIRQVLYGNQFFKKEFGTYSDEYMLPDCFGFPASLPSILAHCGIKGFSTQKLTWGSAVGIPFNVGKWLGPDDTFTVSALNPDAYGSQIRGDLSHSEGWERRLAEDKVKDGVGVDYHYYGTGDTGGSPDEESVKAVEASIHGGGPVDVVAGRADQLFRDLSAEDIAKLPTYKGDLELTQHSAGSLTSVASMKRWNRKNEFLADATERASVAADWLGSLPYDKARITDAWLRFLPGQFHDLMAGTAIPTAYNYAWNDQIIAMNEFAGQLETSVGAVARNMDTRGQGIPLVVYNPLSVERADPVEATVHFPNRVPVDVKVVGPNGREVPSQVLSRSGNEIHLVFQAYAPSIGYSTFHVVAGKSRIVPVNELHVSDHGLENGSYRVKINRDGDVSSVFDKQANKEILVAPLRLAYQHENPNDWPSWNMDWKDQKLPPRAYVTGPAEVKVVENGPVRVALQITRHSEGSTFVQTLRLSRGNSGNRLEFVTHIDWQGKESALKAVFPLAVSNPMATYNWGLGTVQRGNDDPRKYEVASHEWIDLTDKDGA